MINATVSLNGRWDVVFDPKDQGKKKKFFENLPKAQPITVPGVWEQVKPLYDGVGWYRKTFTAPAAWKGKCVRLKFGAVNYFAEVWLNGKMLGAHEGGYTPFEFDISTKALTGANTITVRVIDPPRKSEIEGFRTGAPLSQTDIPTWKAGWYHNFGGIWQPVELIVTEKTFVSDVFVKPSFAKKRVDTEVTVTSKAAVQGAAVTVTAVAADTTKKELFSLTKKVSLKKGATAVKLGTALKSFTAWDCDNPFLYTLTTSIAADKEELHTTSQRFGIRDFGVKNGNFVLNGKRIMLKGFLQQGVYPKTLVFPHNRAMLKKEMDLIKKNGYNFIRAHLKPSTMDVYDMADEMGILILAEPPMGWIERTPKTEKRCLNEVRELVLRDRSRTSVAFWCVFNEAFHYFTFTLGQIETLTKKLMDLNYDLDPTRIIIGNSGGEGRGTNTVAYFPGSRKPRPLLDAHAYYGPTQAGLKAYHKDGAPGVAGFISEFGAPEVLMDFEGFLKNYSPAEKKLGLEEYAQYNSYNESLKERFKQADLKKICKDPTALAKIVDGQKSEQARLMVGAIRSNPNYDGYAFCQLADASGEIFGATDLWRKPKQVFKGLTEASVTPLIVPFVDPRVLKINDPFSFTVKLVNEDQLGKKYGVTAVIKAPGGKPVATFKRNLKADKWVNDVMLKKLKADFKPGQYVLEAKLTTGSKTVSVNTTTFTVLPEAKKTVTHIAAFDMMKDTAPLLKKMGYTVDFGSNNYKFKDKVNVVSMDQYSHPGLAKEVIGQVRRIVKLGGVAVFLEPATPLLYDLIFPKVIGRVSTMRDTIYIQDHPAFAGLPKKCIAGYEYDAVKPGVFSDPHDVASLGGTSPSGTLSSHMWTTPDIFFWGTCLDVVPVGKGHVILCHFKLKEMGKQSRIAENMLVNLINYAATLIKPGSEEKLLSRCIDPV